MPTFFRDAQYALRLLLKSRGFAAVAILTLALGVGATTAIFSVIDAILLRPLPFPDASRLMEVRILGRLGNEFPLPDADFLAWRSQNDSADAVAVFTTEPTTLTGDGNAERIGAAAVTDRFFDVFGTPTQLGRAFRAGDDRPGAPATVVVSHRFWLRRFHGDPNAIGQTLSLSGETHTIIGVMPPSFRFPGDDFEVWRILPMKTPARRGPFYTRGLARVKPGVTVEGLRANLRVVTTGLKRQYPAPGDWKLDALPLHEALVGDVKPVLYLLAGAVAFLLLLATVNVANLMLARATVREREIAVRTALGARRGRIVGQLLTESLVLALLAGALGLVLALWGTRALLRLAPVGIPRLNEVGMNGTVFAFALIAAALCGCFFGLVPALRSTGAPLIAPLKDSGRSGAGRRQRRIERALVVAEVALALVLSAGAGLLIRSFGALQRVSPGFDAGRLLTFELQLPSTQYPEAQGVRAFFDDLLPRLEALPGVRSAALTISLPPNILQVTDNFMVEGQVLPPNQSAPVGPVVMVSEKYFSTLGVPLVRGRVFDERDGATAPPVVIVNEALAAKYFGGVDPIGRRFKIGGPERPIGPNNPWQTVVGVVGNVAYSGLDAPPEPTYYMPFRQNAWRSQFVVVRAAVDPGQLVAGIRSIVASIDRDIPVARLHTMDDLIATSVAPPRFRTTLVTAFAAAGLLLAAIGIYGVMASAVADRTHELGIRIALGADRSSVLRLVLGEAAALTAIGVGVGIAGTLPAARLMRSLLFGVSATDVLTLAGTSALLTATALVASYVPARRAMRIDPVVALRNE